MNQISIAGPWQVTWSGGQHGGKNQFVQPLLDPARYMDISFPGSVHNGLEKTGLIDDPRKGINALKARWVEEQYWVLRRSVDIPAEAVGEPAYLYFGVIDGVAQIALNQEVIGEHSNAFYPAVFDITNRLQPGQNEITILLESGLFKVADLPAADYSQALETVLNKRYHLRQAQYQFGWDWNPRLVYLGLHGDMKIVWGNDPWLKQVTILAEVADDLASARIRVKPLCQLAGNAQLPVVLKLTSTAGLAAQANVTLNSGESEVEVVLEVKSPRLWWPRGYGEAYLYPLELLIETVEGQEIARWHGRTGLRKVEIDQPPHPETGKYFHLKINNRTIFCKGANWVPAELSGHEVDPLRIARLVELAEEENMNILRLWGGGVWANHTLLDLCDERGFLLWHDLLFACAKYPADRPEFLSDVEREVTWGIREFSPHPSLVVWCGNNEMEAGLWEWHYKEFGRTAPDLVLFHHIIPTLMARLDTTRPYWPSSPYSSVTITPSDPTIGDQHPWGVSLGEDDINFWAYRHYVDRFPNEGGVLGCAPVASLRRFLGDNELSMRSFAWEHHDNTITFWRAEPGFPLRQVEYWLCRTVDSMDVETYALASGLLQAEGLKEYILNYRRRWPSTSSAIYWMFNDSWPTVHGWGSFDYYLNRKLAFHPVRRAFADAAVILAEDGESVAVYLSNDTDNPVQMNVSSGDFEPAGPLHEDVSLSILVPARTCMKAHTMQRDPQLIYYAAAWDAAGRLLAQDRLLLRRFGDFKLAPAVVRVDEVERDGQRAARYTSDTWVWSAVLDPTGEQPTSDDVFDLLPGIPYEVPLYAGEASRSVVFSGNKLLE
jgi:beta-mannosidase